MKPKKKLQITYSTVDYEQKEHQKKLDDAFESIFEDIEMVDLERINNRYEFEHPVVIN
jgi:hypothetical protein